MSDRGFWGLVMFGIGVANMHAGAWFSADGLWSWSEAGARVFVVVGAQLIWSSTRHLRDAEA